MPSVLAMAVAPRPCAFSSRTWAASIDEGRAFPGCFQCNASLPEVVNHVLQVTQGAGKPINPRDDQSVALGGTEAAS